MAVCINSPRVIWGVKEPRPIVGAPPGKQRLRMTNKSFAKLFVWNGKSIREFILIDDGDIWRVDPKLEQRRTDHGIK